MESASSRRRLTEEENPDHWTNPGGIFMNIDGNLPSISEKYPQNTLQLDRTRPIFGDDYALSVQGSAPPTTIRTAWLPVSAM